jgi:hypothetical protein
MFWRYLSGLAILVCFSGAAWSGENDDYHRISDIIFNKYEKWEKFEDSTRINQKFLDENRKIIIGNYMSGARTPMLESKDCSTIERLLDNKQYGRTQYFRYIDATGDNHKDLVYSGPAMCSEGDITIVWPMVANKMTKGVAYFNENKLLLRYERSRTPRATFVTIGCCGDNRSFYSVGPLYKANSEEYYGVVGAMARNIPKGLSHNNSTLVLKEEAAFRESPTISDEYDESLSEHFGNAIFGNIVARYYAGAKVTVFADYKDNSGTNWQLVGIYGDGNRYRVHDPYQNVNVGWMIMQ